MKLPNGYGSISKLQGNRRNPFRVRITVKWEYDPVKEKVVQKFKTIGYYKTKSEALAALAEYNKCPYDLDDNNITFKELYEKWSKEYFEKLNSISSQRTVVSAFNYCSALHNKKMREIRTYHLKECIDHAYVIPTIGKESGKKRKASANMKSRIKSLFNLMFDYAIEHEIVDRNYARTFNLDKNITSQYKRDKKEIIPFNNDELEKLWNSVNTVPFTDMIIIGIYSGWRPQELATMQVENVDLDNDTMFGGMKTEAGENRCVPIHPMIKELLKNRCKEARELNSGYVFNDVDGQRGTTMTYDKYRKRFEKVMKRLGLRNHRPHETRHTFISLAKDYCVDDKVIKMIVGHYQDDLTERVYTHRIFAELKYEMEKIQKYRKTEEDYAKMFEGI